MSKWGIGKKLLKSFRNGWSGQCGAIHEEARLLWEAAPKWPSWWFSYGNPDSFGKVLEWGLVRDQWFWCNVGLFFVSESHCTCSFSVCETVMCGNRQTTNSWQEAWFFFLDARKCLVAKETFVYQWEIPKPPISWFFFLRYPLGHLKLFLLVFNSTFISSILIVCLSINQFYRVGHNH